MIFLSWWSINVCQDYQLHSKITKNTTRFKKSRSAVLHTQWVCNTYLKVTVLLGPSPLLRLITYPLGPSRLLRGITYPLGPSPLLRLITYPLGPWPFRTGITYPLGPSLLHRKICEKIWLFYMVLSFKTVSDSPISIQQHIINKYIMLPTFHIHLWTSIITSHWKTNYLLIL